MANKKLENKIFVIPDHIINTVKPGTMRSDFVLRRKNNMSYYNVKRLKNFYDTQIEKDPKTYNALGDDLKKWVETILSVNRDSMYKGKKIKSDIGMLNVFKTAHSKDKSKGKLGIRIPKPNTNARQIFTGKGLYENINRDEMVAMAFYRAIKRDLDIEYLSEPYSYDDNFNIDISVENGKDFSLVFKNGKAFQEIDGVFYPLSNYKEFINHMGSAYPEAVKRETPKRAPIIPTQKGVYESLIRKILIEIKKNKK